ncbi:TlpA disulfide reductase family protein [uncultured Psychroserpens sp.]|uniref:TlpA family protein disulfide reductase n=1 Tax=uncultured Psychroserpens sp. TaxID=255436 RepID=UPI002602BF62|nr:TlpA disulfide reductase family protein [uncultured Psychroserpens sp.]
MKFKLIMVFSLFLFCSSVSSQSNYYDSDDNKLSVKQFDSLKIEYGKTLKIRKSVINGVEKTIVFLPTKNINKPKIQIEKKNVYQFFDEEGKELSKQKFKALVDSGKKYTYQLVNSKEVDSFKLSINNSVDDSFEKDKEILKTKYLNKTIPKTDFYDLKGNLINVNNKIVVLNFWFVNCRPCIKEMPQLNNLVEKYKDKDVVFIAPALDKKVKLVEFLNNTSFKYSIVPSMGDYIRQTLEIQSFPANMVLDKNGKVKFIEFGFSETIEEDLSNHIDRLL